MSKNDLDTGPILIESNSSFVTLARTSVPRSNDRHIFLCNSIWFMDLE